MDDERGQLDLDNIDDRGLELAFTPPPSAPPSAPPPSAPPSAPPAAGFDTPPIVEATTKLVLLKVVGAPTLKVVGAPTPCAPIAKTGFVPPVAPAVTGATEKVICCVCAEVPKEKVL